MKFKSVFVFFTLIALAFLVFVTLIPFLMFDFSVARLFWKSNWPFILILILILGGLDGFYFINRRLFTLLEREDWPALVSFLEGEVIRKGKYHAHLVRLLANTCLVLSDSQGVIRLENRVAIAKPALLETEALVFGVARILSKDFPGAARFFAGRLEAAKDASGPPKKHMPWIRWYYGFSLFLDRQLAVAADQFVPLAWDIPDPVIAGLSAFFLDGALQKAIPELRDELREAAAAGKSRVCKRLPGLERWTRETGHIRAEIHGAVLATYLDDAGGWLYTQDDTK